MRIELGEGTTVGEPVQDGHSDYPPTSINGSATEHPTLEPMYYYCPSGSATTGHYVDDGVVKKCYSQTNCTTQATDSPCFSYNDLDNINNYTGVRYNILVHQGQGYDYAQIVDTSAYPEVQYGATRSAVSVKYTRCAQNSAVPPGFYVDNSGIVNICPLQDGCNYNSVISSESHTIYDYINNKYTWNSISDLNNLQQCVDDGSGQKKQYCPPTDVRPGYYLDPGNPGIVMECHNQPKCSTPSNTCISVSETSDEPMYDASGGTNLTNTNQFLRCTYADDGYGIDSDGFVIGVDGKTITSSVVLPCIKQEGCTEGGYASSTTCTEYNDQYYLKCSQAETNDYDANPHPRELYAIGPGIEDMSTQVSGFDGTAIEVESTLLNSLNQNTPGLVYRQDCGPAIMDPGVSCNKKVHDFTQHQWVTDCGIINSVGRPDADWEVLYGLGWNESQCNVDGGVITGSQSNCSCPVGSCFQVLQTSGAQHCGGAGCTYNALCYKPYLALSPESIN